MYRDYQQNTHELKGDFTEPYGIVFNSTDGSGWQVLAYHGTQTAVDGSKLQTVVSLARANILFRSRFGVPRWS